MLQLRVALVGPEYEENLGLRYLQAAVEQAGHAAKIFDFREPDDLETVREEVSAWGPDVVGLSMMFTRRSREFAALANAFREAGFGGHLTAGGHFASINAESLLRDVEALDSVVIGEGEQALVELLEHLGDPRSVAGLALRLSDGKIVRTAPRPAADDLDQRAWPTREEVLDEILGLPAADVLSGRGCWASCRFCSIDAWHREIGGKRFRQRSVDSIAEEMQFLWSERGARIFNFTDDNFFLPDREQNLRRFRQLRTKLRELRVGRVALQIKARPDCIDEEILDSLKDLGVFRIFLGIETMSARSLEALGRKTTVEQNRRALQLIVEKGFHVSYNLLMFEPETTLADVEANLAFVREFPEVPFGFCRTEVYGGTPLEEQLRQQGRLEGDYFSYDYRITDQAAEKVFRWENEILYRRAFDLEAGMGPRSMALDHQLHLLQHFWPERVDPGLEEKVHAFVRELNLATADMLQRMAEFAAGNPGEAQVAAKLAEWRREAVSLEKSLDRRSKRLFVVMAGLAGAPAQVAEWRFPWTETGIVCLLLTIAAVGIVTVFGQHIRNLFAMSTELAGSTEQTTDDTYAPARKRGLRNFAKESAE